MFAVDDGGSPVKVCALTLIELVPRSVCAPLTCGLKIGFIDDDPPAKDLKCRGEVLDIVFADPIEIAELLAPPPPPPAAVKASFSAMAIALAEAIVA